MSLVEDSYAEVFDGVDRVLAVFAHPDDMEINWAGLVARLCEDGKPVRLVTMTAGDRGVQDRRISVADYRSQRLDAMHVAASHLGIARDQVYCMGLGDGGVEDTVENIGAVVRHIREYKPGLVLTHEPTQFVHSLGPEDPSVIWLNHRDHRKTASVAFDAVYPYSRDRAFFQEQIEAGLDVHEVHDILFGDAFDKPRARRFDITAFRSTKAAALQCHLDVGSISQAEFDAYTTEGEMDGRWYEVLGWLHDFH